MHIKDKTELMKKKCINQKGVRLSIDWIHNLVYYNLYNEIFVFNITDRRYEYLVIEEKEVIHITDLTVNPLDSTIL